MRADYGVRELFEYALEFAVLPIAPQPAKKRTKESKQIAKEEGGDNIVVRIPPTPVVAGGVTGVAIENSGVAQILHAELTLWALLISGWW